MSINFSGFTDVDIQKIEDLFPNILHLPANNDFALIDCPINHEEYHSSKVKYNTLSMEEWELLAMLVQNMMAKDSIICCWTSCKTLPIILYFFNLCGYEYHNAVLTWVKLYKNSAP